MFIFLRYGILVDGSYHNEKKKVPLNPAQIEHYNFQVAKAFDEILKNGEPVRSFWTESVPPGGTWSSCRFGTIPATMEPLAGPRWSGEMV